MRHINHVQCKELLLHVEQSNNEYNNIFLFKHHVLAQVPSFGGGWVSAVTIFELLIAVANKVTN